MFKQNGPFTTHFKLLTPTTAKELGVVVKKYESSGFEFFGSFRTYGGTAKEVNNIVVYEDTGTIDCFYTSKIKADCLIQNSQSGDVFEIISTPENIGMRNMYLQFKVRRMKGEVVLVDG